MISEVCPELRNLTDSELETDFFRTMQSFTSLTIRALENLKSEVKAKNHKEIFEKFNFYESFAGLALLDYCRIFQFEQTLRAWHFSTTRKKTFKTYVADFFENLRRKNKYVFCYPFATAKSKFC